MNNANTDFCCLASLSGRLIATKVMTCRTGQLKRRYIRPNYKENTPPPLTILSLWLQQENQSDCHRLKGNSSLPFVINIRGLLLIVPMMRSRVTFNYRRDPVPPRSVEWRDL